MSATKTGNQTHDSACSAAEGVRQVAVAAATSQSAAQSAEIAYFRTCLASCLANGISPTWAMTALRSLGVTGQ